MINRRASRRLYCVPCGAICPHLEPAAIAAWQAEHERVQHQETGPLTKGAHFAPVPSSWG